MAYKDKTKMYANNNKFIANAYDRINLTIPKGQKAIIQKIASAGGESVNGLINRLINDEIQKFQVQQEEQKEEHHL